MAKVEVLYFIQILFLLKRFAMKLESAYHTHKDPPSRDLLSVWHIEAASAAVSRAGQVNQDFPVTDKRQ
jgi:hypothetical protein